MDMTVRTLQNISEHPHDKILSGWERGNHEVLHIWRNIEHGFTTSLYVYRVDRNDEEIPKLRQARVWDGTNTPSIDYKIDMNRWTSIPRGWSECDENNSYLMDYLSNIEHQILTAWNIGKVSYYVVKTRDYINAYDRVTELRFISIDEHGITDENSERYKL